MYRKKLKNQQAGKGPLQGPFPCIPFPAAVRYATA